MRTINKNLLILKSLLSLRI